MVTKNSAVTVTTIERTILMLRGQRVMLDRDLAVLYGVLTKNLNKAVTRNSDRFPEDFMFQLTQDEFKSLKFQFGTSSWGGTRKLPYAFTEQGVAMLSSVLKSKRAVRVNIEIMRVFVKLRQLLFTHADIAERLPLDRLEFGFAGEKFFGTIRWVVEVDRNHLIPGGAVLFMIGVGHYFLASIISTIPITKYSAFTPHTAKSAGIFSLYPSDCIILNSTK